ncbi:MAG TPA: hypothetical protein DIW61_11670 [Candidatus Aminicenantes bacterium]|nr:hypothetical protein [Candidatus Aminicenantes bacterium]
MGKEDDVLERQAAELYHNFFVMLGYSVSQAREEIKRAVDRCKAEAKANGFDILPENFGDRLIEPFSSKTPLMIRIVDKARRNGATDRDIRRYWNLREWERRLMIWYDNVYRVAAHEKMIAEGLSKEQSQRKLNKSFPYYGDPDDESICQGNDRPLPYEIKDRVNSYMIEKRLTGLEEVERRLEGYSSVNAFLREQMKKGSL